MTTLPQPLLLVTLQGGEKLLVNEHQVVTVRRQEGDVALVKTSNGEELLVVEPTYQAWENDYLSRK